MAEAIEKAITELEKNEDKSGNTLTGSISDENSDGNGAPKAGDDTNPYIWLVVVLLAGAGALVTVSYKKEDKT